MCQPWNFGSEQFGLENYEHELSNGRAVLLTGRVPVGYRGTRNEVDINAKEDGDDVRIARSP